MFCENDMVNRIWIYCNVYRCHLVNYWLVYFIVSLVYLMISCCGVRIGLYWAVSSHLFIIMCFKNILYPSWTPRIWVIDVSLMSFQQQTKWSIQMIPLLGASVNIGGYLNPCLVSLWLANCFWNGGRASCWKRTGSSLYWLIMGTVYVDGWVSF